jgi:hypothetical protein
MHLENKETLALNLFTGGNSPDAKPSTVLAARGYSASVIASAPLPHFRWEGDEVGADSIKKWERKCGDCGGENIKS